MSAEAVLHFTFDSAEDYVAFMGNPSRVTRLEWRKLRQPKLHGLTSHSWLEAYSLGGRHVRYDFFADHGLAESSQAGPDPTSELYEGRAAAAHELSHPLTFQALREKAQRAGARPYSMLEFNCHHFVLEIWNSSVIDTLQRSHYPDRMKTNLLSTLEGSLGSWLSGIGSSWSSTSPAVEVGVGMNVESKDAKWPGQEDSTSPLARISMNKEEGSRVSGKCDFTQYGGFEDDKEFFVALQSDAVFVLDREGDLTQAKLPLRASHREDAAISVEEWATYWLPSVEFRNTKRILKRIGEKHIVDLLARLLKPKSSLASPWSLASIATSSSHCPGHGAATIIDTCYVVLKSDELRLVIYGLVRPLDQNARPWRMRLLSGDAFCGQEDHFLYALRDVSESNSFTCVRDILQEELPILKMALMTNDWGFITLL